MFKAGINSIRENWNLNYSAAFVTCSLVNRTSKVHLGCPHTVSIIHPMDRSVNTKTKQTDIPWGGWLLFYLWLAMKD